MYAIQTAKARKEFLIVLPYSMTGSISGLAVKKARARSTAG
jgi:hypothetical protein